jgi:hypothetical protein
VTTPSAMTMVGFVREMEYVIEPEEALGGGGTIE